MSDYTTLLRGRQPKPNTEIFYWPDDAQPQFYLRRMTFATKADLEYQYGREVLSFAHSHRNIVETLEITKENDEDHWYLYVLTPYMTTLDDDYQRRKREDQMGNQYPEGTLWGYLKELIAAFAYLQSKVTAK